MKSQAPLLIYTENFLQIFTILAYFNPLFQLVSSSTSIQPRALKCFPDLPLTSPILQNIRNSILGDVSQDFPIFSRFQNSSGLRLYTFLGLIETLQELIHILFEPLRFYGTYSRLFKSSCKIRSRRTKVFLKTRSRFLQELIRFLQTLRSIKTPSVQGSSRLQTLTCIFKTVSDVWRFFYSRVSNSSSRIDEISTDSLRHSDFSGPKTLLNLF